MTAEKDFQPRSTQPNTPLAAAQQMTLAIILSGQYKLPQTPAKAAEAGHELLKAVTAGYLNSC
ncbi:hypothetical protein NWF32_20555 [Pseudomonas qingdaonensis]|nr:hypothetical protein [Pseudomonas qingdaonensis]